MRTAAGCEATRSPALIRAAWLAVAILLSGRAASAYCPGAAMGVTPGAGSALLLRGKVVTPTVAFAGEVLVQGDTIVCAAASCAGQPGASDATVIETKGMIFPGLIDASNAVLFDVFDEQDWTPAATYEDHDEWTADARYQALVDAKQYLNGEAGSPVDDGCELDKYGELKALLAGTTSVVGKAVPADRACYGSLARTIDQTPNDLASDDIQVHTLFPSTASADQVCANFLDGSTRAYLVDIAEGTNATALNEFAKLGTVTTTDECLYAPQTAIVDGAALGDSEYATMAEHGMSLVWQPQSDVALYGATADLPLARSHGINVALGTGGSVTGSHNLLDALRFADAVDNESWGDVLSPFDLVQMVTTQAARALALDDVLGSIAAGKKADLTVIAGDCAAPWSELLGARARDVRLVLVGGVPLFGDKKLQAAAPASPGCETVSACGAAKFLCVAESGGTPANKLGQTLADITGTLTSDLAAYDDLDASPWNFAPRTPLMDCALFGDGFETGTTARWDVTKP